ncbi:MAG: biotin/lipoate--protein ligase family protein [Rubrimonas sp.]
MALADTPGLDLPPLVFWVRPPEGVDPFEHARAVAADRGAGALVWSDDPVVLRLAVVLQPESPLREARRAFFVGLAALGDALAAACAPERRVLFDWPGTILYDAARLGGARLSWAPCAENEVPDWLVFGAELIASRPGLTEPGAAPESTSLIEEAFDPAPRIVESFARYLMLYADHWTHAGFGPVAESVLKRMPDAGRDARIEQDGDLTAPGRPRRPLLPALTACAWRDPEAGGPRI